MSETTGESVDGVRLQKVLAAAGVAALALGLGHGRLTLIEHAHIAAQRKRAQNKLGG